jgi:hypothetical protein
MATLFVFLILAVMTAIGLSVGWWISDWFYNIGWWPIGAVMRIFLFLGSIGWMGWVLVGGFTLISSLGKKD